MHSAVYAVMRCLSVCLSHACIVSKLNRAHRQAISTGLHPRDSGLWAANTEQDRTGVLKSCDVAQIWGYVLQTVETKLVGL